MIQLPIDLECGNLGTVGEGPWHAADGDVSYLGYVLDDISYNATNLERPWKAGHR